MLDAEFLNGVLGNEELSVEQRVQSILSEHEASERGLVQKRDELLGNEKKLKQSIKDFEAKEVEWGKVKTDLETKLKANDPEERKQYYESQIAQKEKEWATKMGDIEKERDFYRTSHLKRLQDDAIADGVKDIQFVDGLRNGFIASVLMNNQFEAKDIDGKLMFLNGQNKTIQDVIHDFALTTEGKAYIKNPTSGANTHSSSSSSVVNGQSITRSEFAKLSQEKQRELMSKHIQVING